MEPASRRGSKGRGVDGGASEEAASAPAAAVSSVGGGAGNDAAASPGTERKKRALSEKERRELAKKLREITHSSARQCEKALQLHGDDIDRAADWLFSQTETSANAAGEEAAEGAAPPAAAEPGPRIERFAQLLEHGAQACALVVCNADKLGTAAVERYAAFFPTSHPVSAEAGSSGGDALFTPFKALEERQQARPGKTRDHKGRDEMTRDRPR